MMTGNRAGRSITARPLVLFVALFLLALFLAFFLPQKIFLQICGAFLIVLVGVGIAAFLRKISLRGVLCTAAALAAFLLAGTDIYFAFGRYAPLLNSYNGKEITVSGTVQEMSYSKPYLSYYQIDADTIDGQKVSFSVEVEASFAASVHPRDVVTVRGVFTEGKEENDPSSYYWNLSDRCLGTLRVSSSEDQSITGQASAGFFSFCTDIRNRCGSLLERYLGEDDAALVRAVVLGDKSDLPAAVKRDFRRLGLSHVLAVSGMHLSVIVGGLALLLQALYVPKKVRNAVVIGFVFLFMGIVGFSASVTRAGIMLIIAYLSYYFRENTDPLTSLFAAVGLICAVSPLSAFDVGLQLSFLASAGLLLMGKPLCDRLFMRFGKRNIVLRLLITMLSTMANTVAAVMFTLPVVYWNFREVSLLSLLSNLLIHFPLTALLYGAVMLMLFFWIPGVAQLLTPLLHLSCSAVTLIRRLADLDFCLISLRYPFVLPLLALCGVGTVVLLIVLRKWYIPYIGTLVLCLAFALCLCGWQNAHRDEVFGVYYNDKKCNDAVFLGVNGKLCVIDQSTGTYSRLRAGCDQALESVYTEIDTLIITHLHNTVHTVSVPKICDRYYIRTVLLPEQTDEAGAAAVQSICDALAATPTEVLLYDASDRVGYDFQTLTITVLDCGKIKRSTQPLIAVHIEGQKNGVMVLPPVYQESERYDELLEDARGADYLIFSDHGPKIKTWYAPQTAFSPSEQKYLIPRGSAYAFASDDFLRQYRENIWVCDGTADFSIK